jgi:hypothetical protein
MTVTSIDLARAAKARRMVQLTNGVTGVLLFFPVNQPDRPRRNARLRLAGGKHVSVDPDDVLRVVEAEGVIPSWAIHERLLTLVRLMGEQHDPQAPADARTLRLHTPGTRDTCRGCGHFWPCPDARAVGDRRGFYWS